MGRGPFEVTSRAREVGLVALVGCGRGEIGETDLALARAFEISTVGAGASSPPTPITVGGASIKVTLNPRPRRLPLARELEDILLVLYSGCRKLLLSPPPLYEVLVSADEMGWAEGYRGEVLTSIRGTTIFRGDCLANWKEDESEVDGRGDTESTVGLIEGALASWWC